MTILDCQICNSSLRGEPVRFARRPERTRAKSISTGSLQRRAAEDTRERRAILKSEKQFQRDNGDRER
jgi:hypothetical protein